MEDSGTQGADCRAREGGRQVTTYRTEEELRAAVVAARKHLAELEEEVEAEGRNDGFLFWK